MQVLQSGSHCPVEYQDTPFQLRLQPFHPSRSRHLWSLGAKHERPEWTAPAREHFGTDAAESFGFQGGGEPRRLETQPAVPEALANPLLAVRKQLEHQHPPVLLEQLSRLPQN